MESIKPILRRMVLTVSPAEHHHGLPSDPASNLEKITLTHPTQLRHYNAPPASSPDDDLTFLNNKTTASIFPLISPGS